MKFRGLGLVHAPHRVSFWRKCRLTSRFSQLDPAHNPHFFDGGRPASCRFLYRVRPGQSKIFFQCRFICVVFLLIKMSFYVRLLSANCRYTRKELLMSEIHSPLDCLTDEQMTVLFFEWVDNLSEEKLKACIVLLKLILEARKL